MGGGFPIFRPEQRQRINPLGILQLQMQQKRQQFLDQQRLGEQRKQEQREADQFVMDLATKRGVTDRHMASVLGAVPVSPSIAAVAPAIVSARVAQEKEAKEAPSLSALGQLSGSGANIAEVDEATIRTELARQAGPGPLTAQTAALTEQAGRARELERLQVAGEFQVKAAREQARQTERFEEAKILRRQATIIDSSDTAKLEPRNPRKLAINAEDGKTFDDPFFGVPVTGKIEDRILQQDRLDLVEWAADYQASIEDLAANESAGALTDLNQFLARRGIGEEPSARVANVQDLKNRGAQLIARAREKGRLSDPDVARAAELLLQTAEIRTGDDGRLIGAARRRVDNLRNMTVNKYSSQLRGDYDVKGVRQGVAGFYTSSLDSARTRNQVFSESPLGANQSVPGAGAQRLPSGELVREIP